MKTYVKIEDDLPANLKVRSVSASARWCYVSSICYAGHNLTDGVIPIGALVLVDSTPKIAAELLTAGLWEQHPKGYYIHDFPKHNRTRSQVEEIRLKASEAGAKGLAKRYGKTSRAPSEKLADGYEKLAEPLAKCQKKLAKPLADALQARSDPLLSVIPTDPPLSDYEVTDQRSEISASETPSKTLAKRELSETILAAIPTKFRYDDLLHDEVQQFVEDFPGTFVETAKAIAECRRERELPFPGNLRKYMPGNDRPVADERWGRFDPKKVYAD